MWAMRALRATFLFAVSFAATGCSLLVSLDDLSPVQDGGSDGAGDAETDAGDAGAPDAPCQGTHGPVAERIPQASASYCIDKTEVTVSDYALFLAAKCPGDAGACDLSGLPPECAFKASFVTTDVQDDAGSPARPVGDVDWCDAWAFCAWAGKRLCGKVGGGPLPPADAADASAGEWMHACAGDPPRAFPYGDVFDPSACTTGLTAAPPPPVGSAAKCVGAYPELFDMSGGIEEWENDCSATTGPADMCNARGGSFFYTDPASLACASEDLRGRGERHTDVGIRCCGD
jgi:formylglycine-generating enzyme required for sulfatase activity